MKRTTGLCSRNISRNISAFWEQGKKNKRFIEESVKLVAFTAKTLRSDHWSIGVMEYWSIGIMNLGIQGLRIRKFLKAIIPQFLNFTHYSIIPAGDNLPLRLPAYRQAGAP
jgi:hypothetical protein